MAIRSATLWHHSAFLKLWTGQTVSQFGSTITREALPLTALLVLSATPFQMGLLAAIGSAPPLLVGLAAGLWVDRRRRRPLLIAADLIRAVLLASIPLAALTGHLSLTLLLIVAPLAGVLTVLFDVAHQSYVPALVQQERLVEANGKLAVSGSLAEVTAPGAAGVLVQLISAPLTILIDAVSFLVSAVLLAAIQAAEPLPRPAGEGTHVDREVIEGLRFVAGNASLRALAGQATMASFFGNFYAGLYALYCLRDLGLGPALLGICVAGGGAGSLVGALLVERVIRRFGVGTSLLAALGLGGLVGFLTPLAGGPLVLATGLLLASQVIGDGADSVFNVIALSLRQAMTPDALLGRVNGALYLLAMGIGPLGALVGGFLAGQIGTRETLAVSAVGSALAGLWILFSPVRSLPTLDGVEQGIG